MQDDTPLPIHADPIADAITKLMLATEDLEAIARGETPEEVFFLRELAVAGRRVFEWMCEADAASR